MLGTMAKAPTRGDSDIRLLLRRGSMKHLAADDYPTIKPGKPRAFRLGNLVAVFWRVALRLSLDAGVLEAGSCKKSKDWGN